MKFVERSLDDDAAQSEIASSIKTLRVEVIDGDLQLVRPQIKLTRWAFDQICQLVGIPSDYLAALPATLAAQNLNHALAVLSIAINRGDGMGWRGYLTLYVFEDTLQAIFTGVRPDFAKEAL